MKPGFLALMGCIAREAKMCVAPAAIRCRETRAPAVWGIQTAGALPEDRRRKMAFCKCLPFQAGLPAIFFSKKLTRT
jgi:hypothetical protein